MQTRGIEMSQLYTLIRDSTNLTEVQAKILDHEQVALQFAADISKNQVYLCAKGKNSDISVILLAVRPSYTHSQTFFKAGDTFLRDELSIVENVFSTGRKVAGRMELDQGRKVAVTGYPIVDNAGVPFAVVCFVSSSLDQQQVLTDTGSLALQVPFDGKDYYGIRPQDGVIILDSLGRIIYSNDMANDLYMVLDKEAVESQENIGHTIVRFPLVDEVMKTGRPVFGDEVSENMTLSAWGLPIISGGKVTRTVLILTDVTAIREKEKQILVKDSVIKEIHHRVKNSLNTIAGMLRMQARRAKDPDTKDALKRSVNRILGISQIHDILASQSGGQIDMDVLLDRICKLSVDSLTFCPVRVVREKGSDPLIVDSEKAVPLAIAANELIHNAIDHGFNGMDKGILIVGTSLDEEKLHVYIKNNGHPLSPEVKDMNSSGLGLQIVRNLVEIELKGSFELRNDGEFVTADIYCSRALMGA